LRGPIDFCGEEECPEGYVDAPDPELCSDLGSSPSSDSPLNIAGAEALVDELYYDFDDDELNEAWERDVLSKISFAATHPEITDEARNALLVGLEEYLEIGGEERFRAVTEVLESAPAEEHKHSEEFDCLCYLDCDCDFTPGVPPACYCIEVCPPGC